MVRVNIAVIIQRLKIFQNLFVLRNISHFYLIIDNLFIDLRSFFAKCNRKASIYKDLCRPSVRIAHENRCYAWAFLLNGL